MVYKFSFRTLSVFSIGLWSQRRLVLLLISHFLLVLYRTISILLPFISVLYLICTNVGKCTYLTCRTSFSINAVCCVSFGTAKRKINSFPRISSNVGSFYTCTKSHFSIVPDNLFPAALKEIRACAISIGNIDLFSNGIIRFPCETYVPFEGTISAMGKVAMKFCSGRKSIRYVRFSCQVISVAGIKSHVC